MLLKVVVVACPAAYALVALGHWGFGIPLVSAFGIVILAECLMIMLGSLLTFVQSKTGQIGMTP